MRPVCLLRANKNGAPGFGRAAKQRVVCRLYRAEPASSSFSMEVSFGAKYGTCPR